MSEVYRFNDLLAPKQGPVCGSALCQGFGLGLDLGLSGSGSGSGCGSGLVMVGSGFGLGGVWFLLSI